MKAYDHQPAILCVQGTAEKIIISEEELIKSNWQGMGGGNVGAVTNRGTAMFSVLKGLDKNTQQDEINELMYRIVCIQKNQQDAIESVAFHSDVD